MIMRYLRMMVAALALWPIMGVTASLAQGASPVRVALVIGNAKYPDGDAPLVTPVDDARAVAEQLEKLGFVVKRGDNMTRAGMVELTDRFLAEIRPGATAVVFFAGYGIQSGRQNYLVPVDGQIWTETDVQRHGIAVPRLLSELDQRGAGNTFLMLDAAYRNPFERRFRSFSTGLAPLATLPQNAAIIYSASPGAVLRQPSASPSAFGAELVRQMAAAGTVSRDVFDRTRTGVAEASKSDQTPWVFSSVREPPPVTAATLPPPVSPAGPPPVVVGTALPGSSLPQAEPPKRLPAPDGRAPAGGAVASRPSPPSGIVPGAGAPGGKGEVVAARRPLPYSADDEKVKADLTVAIGRNGNDVVSYFTRGQIFALHYDFERALADFDQVIRLSPKDVDALNNRCWVRAILNQVDGALSDCNAALGFRPNFLDALDSRGFLHLKIGLTGRAVSDYDAALKVNNRHAPSLYGRGLALVRMGEAGRGDGDMKAALSIDPNIATEFSVFGLR